MWFLSAIVCELNICGFFSLLFDAINLVRRYATAKNTSVVTGQTTIFIRFFSLFPSGIVLAGVVRSLAETRRSVPLVVAGLHVLQRRAPELRPGTRRVCARKQSAGRHRAVQEQAVRHGAAMEQR